MLGLDPKQYSEKVKAYDNWLKGDAAIKLDSQAKIKKFFQDVAGIDPESQPEGGYSALEIQHKVGIALRELLAYLAEKEPRIEDRLDPVKIREFQEKAEGGYKYPYWLMQEDIIKLNAYFGNPAEHNLILNTVAQRKAAHNLDREIAEFTQLPALDQRIQRAQGLVKDYLGAYLDPKKLSSEQRSRAIYSTIDHYTVEGTAIIANGNCGAAALATQLAAQIGIKCKPLTEEEYIQYSESGDFKQQVFSTSTALRNGIPSDEAQLQLLQKTLGEVVVAINRQDCRHEHEGVVRFSEDDKTQMVNAVKKIVMSEGGLSSEEKSFLLREINQYETILQTEVTKLDRSALGNLVAAINNDPSLQKEVESVGGLEAFIKAQQAREAEIKAGSKVFYGHHLEKTATGLAPASIEEAVDLS